jgi:DNA-binding GntR family transcriptional regulator
MTEQPSIRASARVHARIIQMVLTGELPPGTAMQEARLAEVLDMSRTPVREALKRIEAEGLARRDGRFLRVRRLEASEIMEIFALREALEGFSARVAIGLPLPDISAMAARVRALMASDPDDGEMERAVDDDLHQMIAHASENRTLARVIGELRLRTCMFDVHQVPDRFLRGSVEHLEILEALAARDGPLAEARMIAHVRNAGAAILGRLKDLAAGHANPRKPA